jgi:hypothetical protein
MADPLAYFSARTLWATCRDAGRIEWDRLHWEAGGIPSLGTLIEDMTGGRSGIDPALRSPLAIVAAFAALREGKLGLIADGGPDLGYGVGLVVPRGLLLGAGVFVAETEASAYICGWDYGEVGPRFYRPRFAADPPDKRPAGRGNTPYDDSEAIELASAIGQRMPKFSYRGAAKAAVQQLRAAGKLLDQDGKPVDTDVAEKTVAERVRRALGKLAKIGAPNKAK